MPTVREIEAFLFRFAPKETAMGWDNVGQLLGEPEQEVRRALVALDITDAVAEEALDTGCELIVSHHPVMNCHWLPVQTVRGDTPQGRLLLKLLRGGVSCVCMHTNLDLAPGGVNDCLATALGLQNPEPLAGSDGLCRVGALPEPMPLERFIRHVSAALHCNGVRWADAGRLVHRVATGGGACGEYVGAALAAGCDTFLTADLKYHGFLDAVAAGINLIDAGHFPTENPVCGKLADLLKTEFPALDVRKSAAHGEVIHCYTDSAERG